MLVRDVSGAFGHDSNLLVLWLENCLAGVILGTSHQTALADSNVSHCDAYLSLKVTAGRIQLIGDVTRFKETLQRTIR